jgi:hypothetical protein
MTHRGLIFKLWPTSAPSRQSGIGGVPACRQAGRDTIKAIFPLLASLSPHLAQEAPACGRGASFQKDIAQMKRAGQTR